MTPYANISQVELREVTFGFDASTVLFKKASWLWPAGQIYELRALQGQGKSILIHLLAGLSEPSEGQVLINGMNIHGVSFERFLPLRVKIGVAFDLGGLLHNRTLFENLMLPLHYHEYLPYAEAEYKIMSLLDKFDLIKFKDFRPSFVSGSVRKIVVLIRSLLFDPDVLLLDDPFVGLNDRQRRTFVSLIDQLRQKGGASRVLYSDSTGCNLMPDIQILEIRNCQLIDHAIEQREDVAS